MSLPRTAERPSPSFAEELASSVTHGLGLALSVAGLAVLVVFAALRGTAWHMVSCAVYGGTLVILYAASTLYHCVPARRMRAKRVLRIVDHAAIYLLIAGTYTPFALVTLRGGWGWTLFGIIWGLALTGVIFKVFLTGRFPILSTLVYLAMGWLVVIAWKPVTAALPASALAWLAAGGIAYTAGVLFFALERLRFGHAVWHVFVLAGSICHYFAVLFHVVLSQG
jgi:hemolysin III